MWDKLKELFASHGKWSLLLLVASWSFYATSELTRLILAYANYEGMRPIYQFELAFIWLGYITVVVIVGLLIRGIK